MKRTLLLFVFAIAAVFAFAGSASAQIAYNAAFTTSITYQNVGTNTANIVFNFYPENNGTAIPVNRTLAPNAGGSLFVGSLNEINPGFNGSAVLSSDQPIVATMVQISSDTAVKNRPLSNGFSSGASEFLLATVLKNQFATTSRFAVQNAHSGPVNLTIRFYNANNPGATPITVTHNNLPAGAAKYFDMGQLPQITAANFNGSAVISAVDSSNSNPAPIVASVLELSTNADAASSFEGVTGGANTVYMATALCNAFGASSAYAVQNTSQSSSANVTVTYSNGATHQATVASGAKFSFQTCDRTPAGFSGSATITSSGAPIVAIGKVFGSGNSTAFVGETSGSSKIALPYVRFTTSQWLSGARQRTYLAIQNVGSAIPAGQVTVKYLNVNGQVVGTHTLGAMSNGQKLNSHATHPDVVGNASNLQEFGYIGGFGGSVLIEGPSGSQLVAIARVQSYNSSTGGVVGEDFSGIAISNP